MLFKTIRNLRLALLFPHIVYFTSSLHLSRQTIFMKTLFDMTTKQENREINFTTLQSYLFSRTRNLLSWSSRTKVIFSGHRGLLLYSHSGVPSPPLLSLALDAWCRGCCIRVLWMACEASEAGEAGDRHLLLVAIIISGAWHCDQWWQVWCYSGTDDGQTKHSARAPGPDCPGSWDYTHSAAASPDHLHTVTWVHGCMLCSAP